MQNTDVLEIDGAADYLAPISELDRARKYPYHAPQGGFILNAGRLLPLTEGDLAASASAILGGRVAVLSVGSNRAPVQLLRKFGTAATVPVTPARLHDCDIVHAALIGYYAAVPCTAFPSVGTVVDLNVAWLDPEQLVQMHRTEGIGVAYDFVEMDNVEHLFTLSAAFSGALSDGPVFGYAARPVCWIAAMANRRVLPLSLHRGASSKPSAKTRPQPICVSWSELMQQRPILWLILFVRCRQIRQRVTG